MWDDFLKEKAAGDRWTAAAAGTESERVGPVSGDAAARGERSAGDRRRWTVGPGPGPGPARPGDWLPPIELPRFGFTAQWGRSPFRSETLTALCSLVIPHYVFLSHQNFQKEQGKRDALPKPSIQVCLSFFFQSLHLFDHKVRVFDNFQHVPSFNHNNTVGWKCYQRNYINEDFFSSLQSRCITLFSRN